jgi:hypothetical protein
MEITTTQQTTTTLRNVRAEIDNTQFEIELTEQDGTIVRAYATVSIKEEVLNADGETVTTLAQIGAIVYENGAVTTQRLTLNESSCYVPQFVSVMNELRKEVQEQ